MADKSLQDILGYLSLTGSIQANVPDLPRVLPDGFYKGKKNVERDAGRYTRFTSNRTTSRTTVYGAPATTTNLLGVGEKDVKLIHSYESISMDPLILQALRNYTNYDLQSRGKDEVARQVAEFRRRFRNLRNTVMTSAVTTGKVYTDKDGNLLSSSSGAVVTVDFGVPAGQAGDATIATYLAAQGSGPSGNWTSNTTDIPTQLLSMKQLAQFQHGYEPEIIIYGKNIPGYLAHNDYMQPYLAREPEGFRPNWVTDGDIAPTYDLFGYRWYSGMRAFWKDQNGVTRQIIGDNAIIFLPGPSSDWWENLEGSFLVPKTFQPLGDLSAANDSFDQVYGQFAYALATGNPPGIQMYMGDTFLPVIKIPEVVYSLTAA